MIEIDLGNGTVGVAQLICFLDLSNLPGNSAPEDAAAVVVRWLTPHPLALERDACQRPLCAYPLSANHCLWQWADAGRDRPAFRQRGFNTRARMLWRGVPTADREAAIRGEKRARYDVIRFNSILRHANVARDPTTGGMLPTLQMI